MSLTKVAEEDIKKAIEAHFHPIKTALENVGYTVKLQTWAARFDYRAGGQANVSSHLREHWSCTLRLHSNWKTGQIERITVQARPARTVTIKYTDKALPGLLERIAACFQADIDAEARRKQNASYADQWTAQAVADMKDIPAIPQCMVPSWRRDQNPKVACIENLHQGMPRTPIGRYFPRIDEQSLCGTGGLTAAQLKFLCEALCKLPDVK